MDDFYKFARVRFAQEDYQLLVGSALMIFAILVISYFTLFVEPSPSTDDDKRESHAQPSEITSSTTRVTPKKSRTPVKEEVPAKSPVKSQTEHDQHDESEHNDEEEDTTPVTPAPRRGRKKADKGSEDLGALISPEGRRTSLRIRKKKEEH